jgi:DNA-binding NarL/FixJ family response regulator
MGSAPRSHIRVVIADDHGLVRRGTREILEGTDVIDVVGEAADGQEAVDLVTRLVPDVVLLDIGMPVLNGVEAATIIHQRYPEIRILMLTVHGDVEYLWQAIRAGASGYLLKDTTDAALVDAVKTIAGGRSVLDPTITHLVLDRIRLDAALAQRGPTVALTDRETETLTLAARGLSNREIGEALDRSPRTIEVHLHNAFKKLGVNSRTEGVVLALKQGLISLETQQ